MEEKEGERKEEGGEEEREGGKEGGRRGNKQELNISAVLTFFRTV